ncbi:MAG: hypothetical protein C0464_03620 [Cyanobacteria bacterium DS2.008]|uniref:hypothetical protein n=1 Tax=Blastomonas sp. TaxID=1909299 RepID=UPI0018178401|nr:hypothetical protein [Cyanobacteria bacterium DS2.008]MBA4781364.1 hypothetical protein [Blastomonas sp.]
MVEHPLDTIALLVKRAVMLDPHPAVGATVHDSPCHGQMGPEQLEIDRLRREVAKLKAERDIV